MKFKILFKKPKHTPIILLYPHREKLFKDFVFKDIPYQVVDVGSLVCLNPAVLMKTLELILKGILNLKSKKDFIIINIIKRIYENHLQAYIEVISPKICITFIDDSSVFHRLNRSCKNINFIAMQNGMRPKCYFDYLSNIPDSLKKDNLPLFYCFGKSDIDLFGANNYDINKFNPIGSFIGGIYWGEISNGYEVKYDICYISQFVSRSKKNFLSLGERKLYDADISSANIIEKNLKKLVDETGLTLQIALRNENSNEERSHFKKVFGEKAFLIEQSKSDFSSYKAIDTSRIVLSIYSTIAAEAFGIGRRVLFCNGSSDLSIGLPGAGICYYEGRVYNDFKNKIDMLMSMDNQEYQKLTHNDMKYIMNFDINNLPHNILRNKINTLIN